MYSGSCFPNRVTAGLYLRAERGRGGMCSFVGVGWFRCWDVIPPSGEASSLSCSDLYLHHYNCLVSHC